MLCDSMDCGGAETHILTLAGALVARGHSVCVLSRGGRLVEELLAVGVRHVSARSFFPSFVSAIAYRIKLCRLLDREKFDVVHAHSRRSAFLANKIALRRGIGFAVTAHAHFSLSPLRRYFSRWGISTIAVSEDIKQYLIKNYLLKASNVFVIPNGVDEKRFSPSAEQREIRDAPRIAFLSRLDGDCSLGAHLLCEIAEEISQKYPTASVTIGGAGSEYESVCKKAAEVNRRLGKEFIACVGEVRDTAKFFCNADIFVGVSRAAIEAGLSGLRIILCGNEGFSGLLSPQNFEPAAATNFCARGEQKASAELLKNHIFSLLNSKNTVDMRKLFLENYSLKSFAKNTEEIYKRTPRSCTKDKAKTLLCGYYGYGNVGDDAMLAASLRRARRQYPNESISVMTKNGKTDSLRFGANCIDRTNPVAIVLAIARCKRLIFGGGTLLQSTTSRRSLLYYCALLMLAGCLKKECILWANGIELPRKRVCRWLLRAALKNCSYIGARDTRSLAIAKELAPKAEVLFEDDLAKSEFLSASDNKRINFLLRSAFEHVPERFVIAVPRAKADSSDIALLVKALLAESKQKIPILVVPMCYGEDKELCRELCKSLNAKMLDAACFEDIVGLATGSMRLYSMRYHGLVAASLGGAEGIGVGSSEKIETYCNENHLKRIFAERRD